MSNTNPLYKEIETLVGEVNELLRKSGQPMVKADGEEELTPPADDMGAPPAEGPEAESDAIAEQTGGAADDGDANLDDEGLDEAAGQSDADVAAEAQSLSDEELDRLLEVLMAEKESRKSPEQEQAPMEAPGAPAPQEMAPAEKSMKDDYAKLGKSLESVVGSIEALNKKVDALATPKAPAKVSAKAAPANATDAQVLRKSAPAVQRLSKSDTLSFAEGQIRKGNKLINRDDILNIMHVNSDEELHALQNSLTQKGLEFPKV